MSKNANLIARLITAGLTRLPCGSYQVGNTAAAMSERDSHLEGITHTEDRSKTLCSWQLRSYGRFKTLSIGSNIYGFALLDYMGANIRGGRASVTARGTSLAGCVEAGLREVESGTPGWRAFTFPTAMREEKLDREAREFVAEVEVVLATAV